jgi:hypothetical protein
VAKVITGTGLQEFIESGKHETLPDKPEIKPAHKALAPPEEKAETPPPQPPPEETNEGLEADDVDLTEHVRKKINKKHRQMKEAQEQAADAETFAKGQYERARLAEERASALEKELQATKSAPQVKAPELKKPDIKDFTDDKGQVRWTDYTESSATYAAAKAVQDERARQAQERDAAEQAEVVSKFKERAAKIPDFESKLAAAQTWFPQPVLDYLTASEDGPELSMLLASDSETATRIAKLKPILAIAELGKLAKTLNVPKKAETPEPKVIERGGAPPPITPISSQGSGTVQTDPSKMGFKELREYERAKRKKH